MFVGLNSPLYDPEAGRNLSTLTLLTNSVAVEHSRVRIGSHWECIIYELQGGFEDLGGFDFDFFCVWDTTPQDVEAQLRACLQRTTPEPLSYDLFNYSLVGFDRNGLVTTSVSPPIGRVRLFDGSGPANLWVRIVDLELPDTDVSDEQTSKPPSEGTSRRTFWDHILEED